MENGNWLTFRRRKNNCELEVRRKGVLIRIIPSLFFLLKEEKNGEDGEASGGSRYIL